MAVGGVTDGPGALLLGFLLAVAISMLTTPVGVSGAVFLLPVQVSVLGVPSPSVTPTNLLYNVVATPGALLRYRGQGQFDARLTTTLLAGTVPGVVLGAWLRVHHLAGEDAFRILLAGLLLPLGAWLLLPPAARSSQPYRPQRAVLAILGLAVGVVGGLLGIGGGSLVAPVLVGLGLAVVRVAPSALTVTLLTSVVGVATFALVGWLQDAGADPEWTLGLVLGAGGLVGGYLGARLQPHVPERILRRLLGLLAVGIAVAYLR